MKDGTSPCAHALSDQTYKDVVVIGNGPSGMVTSFMLAGNVPYLKQIPDDLPIDDMLRARLSSLPPGQSLYEADLLHLAEGLEGRSQNPIPLLMDNLLRPCADQGLQADSLIEWKFEIDKQIDHVVVGREGVGGSWQSLGTRVRSVSPAAWLALPPHSTAAPGQKPGARLRARRVARYCRRYVRECGLQRFMVTHVAVTGVRPLSPPPQQPCSHRCPLRARFHVTGYDSRSGRCVSWRCFAVVAACGARGLVNSLAAAPSAARSADALAAALAQRPRPRHALVVGSGLSAADAVRACRARNVLVRHLHRGPPPALSALAAAPALYPDYAQVYKMMVEGAKGSFHNYSSFGHHALLHVSPSTARLLDLRTQEVIEVEADVVAVLIGSRPDLHFLPWPLGQEAAKAVGPSNPVAVRPRSHASLRGPPGLFALGPLTNDSFVRFIPGGALAIVAHLHRHRATK